MVEQVRRAPSSKADYKWAKAEALRHSHQSDVKQLDDSVDGPLSGIRVVD